LACGGVRHCISRNKNTRSVIPLSQQLLDMNPLQTPPFRRLSCIFLCSVPFLNFGVVGVRALRVPGIHQALGVAYFAAIAVATLTLIGPPTTAATAGRERRLVLSGLLLLLPSALAALLWVGLGPPWLATPTENRMRYLVLLIDTISVTAGFLVLQQALHDDGERLYSPLATAFATLAGAAYLVWNCLFLGLYVLKARGEPTPAAFVSLSDAIDALIFIACFLTYLATLIFAVCLGRLGWLRARATRAFAIASLLLLALIVIRGLSYPDPTSKSAPWYLNLGFIAGIPAVPWIMPYLLGVVLLRRPGTGTHQR
jgi:hypothetical protein